MTQFNDNSLQVSINNSTENFLSPIPVSGFIYKRNENDKNTNFSMTNNKKCQKCIKN